MILAHLASQANIDLVVDELYAAIVVDIEHSILGRLCHELEAASFAMTTTEQNECDFRHEALPDAGHYMRLLEVRHSNYGSDIKVDGNLSTWSVDDVPPYSAISYTWGDPDSTTDISMNGKRMRVQQNCEFALLQILNYGECRYIWIDAICIDQTNEEEKAEQVAMMGDIYWYAECLLACVGPHKNDSEFLTGEIQRRHRMLAYASYLGFTELKDAKWRIFGWMLRHRIRTMNRLFEALLNFLKRSYFSRVWILQELCMGQQVMVCCGMDQIPIEALHGLCLLFTSYHSPAIIPFELAHYTDSKTAWMSVKLFLAKAISSVWILQRLVNFRDGDVMGTMDSNEDRISYVAAAANLEAQSYYLSDAINQVRDMRCQDPRDRVYGILAVVHWIGSRKINPDYRKERSDLAVDVLQALMENIPSSSDLQYPSHWASHFVSLVILSLELDPEDQNIRAKVQFRRLLLEEEGTKLIGQCQSLLRCKDYGWRAFQLFHDDGWKLDDEWPAAESVATSISPPWDHDLQQNCHIVRATNGKIAGLVPRSVHPADWIVFFGQKTYINRSHEWEYVNLSLILREDQHGHFSILGQAVFNLDLLRSTKGPRGALDVGVECDLYFDPEDHLVLMCQEHLFQNLENMKGMEIGERLATRVCGLHRSSYGEVRK